MTEKAATSIPVEAVTTETAKKRSWVGLRSIALGARTGEAPIPATTQVIAASTTKRATSLPAPNEAVLETVRAMQVCHPQKLGQRNMERTMTNLAKRLTTKRPRAESTATTRA